MKEATSMKVVDRKIKELIPAEYNPRWISDDALEQLKASIKRFDKLEPIIVNMHPERKNIIISGHQRVKAAKELGLDTFPAVEVELDLDQERELNVRMNKNTGDWDWDELANHFSGDELQDWGFTTDELFGDGAFEEPEAEEDNFEVPDEDDIETDIQEGDLIEIGRHRLLCGDSTDKEQVAYLMDGSNADMVFTDPPYNIDYQGINDDRKVKNDKMSDEDFVEFISSSLSIDNDVYYVCCSWQYYHLFRKALKSAGIPLKAVIVWDKVNPAQNLDKYYKQHEFILYSGPLGGEETLRGDVWQCKRQQNTVHPTMKPIEIISTALKDNPTKDIVYDSFLGSGSTMVAAHQLNRTCYGMELEPKYCQVIIDRMVELDPTLAVTVNGEPYKNSEKTVSDG